MPFQDRVDAGRRLARRLRHLRGQNVVVLAVPRGGVLVGLEVASALEVPLDVIVVRKLGAPLQPELAMGAVGEGGVHVLNEEVILRSGVNAADLDAIERREWAEVEGRVRRFRAGRPRERVAGRTAVVVDDGVATGSTARAACRIARASGAQRVVLAVPIAPAEAVDHLRQDADELVCLETPQRFFAVAQWYLRFAQVSDDQVVRILAAAAERPSARLRAPAAEVQAAPRDTVSQSVSTDVVLPVGAASLAGHMEIPADATGMVLFAHGSGRGRHSRRSGYVAHVLVHQGMGTLLVELLTAAEASQRGNVFDLPLLSDRLVAATHWLQAQPQVAGLGIGLFGGSTGAAAALVAAAQLGDDIRAVVSRGGRPDLAGAALASVHAPTLLIVGGEDPAVLQLNQDAQMLLGADNRLRVVPGAGQRFDEPGALAAVAELAAGWFATHLGPPPGPEDVARPSTPGSPAGWSEQA